MPTLIRSLIKNGKTPIKVSEIGTFFAILLIIKTFKPTGGVIRPTSTTIKVKIPNQIATSSTLIPKSNSMIIGKNTGIVNSIMAKYGMIRTRLMASKPKTCLTIHADMSKRIHIPLMSNPECLMVIEDRAYYLEPGKVYLTNTTLRHTALNGSQTNRLHIVGCIYS